MRACVCACVGHHQSQLCGKLASRKARKTYYADCIDFLLFCRAAPFLAEIYGARRLPPIRPLRDGALNVGLRADCGCGCGFLPFAFKAHAPLVAPPLPPPRRILVSSYYATYRTETVGDFGIHLASAADKQSRTKGIPKESSDSLLTPSPPLPLILPLYR